MLENLDHPKREDVEVVGRCPTCKRAKWVDLTTTYFNPDGTIREMSHSRTDGDCSCP